MDHHLDRLGQVCPWLLTLAVALVVAAALALPGVPGAGAAASEDPQARPAPAPRVAAVALDAEGGGLRPTTAEESRRLHDAMRRMFPPDRPAHIPARHADGSVSLVLDTTYATFDAVARTTPAAGTADGTR